MTTDDRILPTARRDRRSHADRTGIAERRRRERGDAITALAVRIGSGLLVVAALAAAVGGWIATLT